MPLQRLPACLRRRSLAVDQPADVADRLQERQDQSGHDIDDAAGLYTLPDRALKLSRIILSKRPGFRFRQPTTD